MAEPTAPLSEDARAASALGSADADTLSLFTVGATLLAQRWRIVRWSLLVAALATAPAFANPPGFSATASFAPQASDAGQAGVRALAGQLGVSLPSGSALTQSPEFYRELVSARAILEPILTDSATVDDGTGAERTVLELLHADAPTPALARERGVRALRRAIQAGVNPRTGVVTVSVTTELPSLSHKIAERLVSGVNEFNLLARQSHAAEERRFVEARIDAQRKSLEAAEGRLGAFLVRNRQFQNSPALVFEHDRLQREVALHQEVLITLAQALEDARIREVRDVPVITVVETPILPVRPDPRRLPLRAVVGLLVGCFVGVLLASASEMIARRRLAGDPEVERLALLAGDTWSDITRWIRWKGR